MSTERTILSTILTLGEGSPSDVPERLGPVEDGEQIIGTLLPSECALVATLEELCNQHNTLVAHAQAHFEEPGPDAERLRSRLETLEGFFWAHLKDRLAEELAQFDTGQVVLRNTGQVVIAPREEEGYCNRPDCARCALRRAGLGEASALEAKVGPGGVGNALGAILAGATLGDLDGAPEGFTVIELPTGAETSTRGRGMAALRGLLQGRRPRRPGN